MFDLLIKNAVVCSGGKPVFPADIAVKGDKIAAVEPACSIPAGQAARTIDAGGMTVTPGFIDPHTHVDESILFAPDCEVFLKQGVTTVVAGNCGHSLAPAGPEAIHCTTIDTRLMEAMDEDETAFASFFHDKAKAACALKGLYNIDLDWDSFASFQEKCDKLPPGCNIAPLAGYNAVRTAIMGMDCKRQADAKEIEKLTQLTKTVMEEGAFGLSTGRDPNYVPGPFATDEEMIQVLKEVSAADGIFSSHTYNYKNGVFDRMGGYEEMLRQAAGAGVKANVSHVHCALGMAKTPEEAERAAEATLALFDRAAGEGIDLTYDVIPSPMASDFTLGSVAFHIKPLVLMSGSRKRLARNLRDPAFRTLARTLLEEGRLTGSELMFAEMTVLKHRDKRFEGHSLTECGRLLGCGPFDALLNLFMEDPDMIADISAPSFGKSVEILCKDSRAMPCSDGTSFKATDNQSGAPEVPIFSNSTNVGFLPRFLTVYGKDRFEQAVYQATGMPADRFGLKNRGFIREGCFADLVILDRDRLRSFDETDTPLKDPEGIETVILNGRIVKENGALTEVRAGRVLRKV